MKYSSLFTLPVAALLAAAGAGAASAGAPAPIRHLVYDFTVTLSTTSTVHSSGIGDGATSGSTDYRAANTDHGQIVVDVVAVQPDTGLVVRISETGYNTRNSVPTMCVTYGNGTVICDQSTGGVNEEESSLLRLLGRNFVNQSEIDNKNHWHTAQTGPQAQETNDYTIDRTNGDLLDISLQRVLKVTAGAQPFDATTDGRITYNQKMSVPTKVVEDTTTHKNTGMGNYDRIQQQISLTLSSDSMQQAAQGH
jgi:hypothetical protein